MRFKLYSKNIPLLAAAIANVLVVFAGWTATQSASAIAVVTALAAVAGWTE